MKFFILALVLTALCLFGAAIQIPFLATPNNLFFFIVNLGLATLFSYFAASLWRSRNE